MILATSQALILRVKGLGFKVQGLEFGLGVYPEALFLLRYGSVLWSLIGKPLQGIPRAFDEYFRHLAPAELAYILIVSA